MSSPPQGYQRRIAKWLASARLAGMNGTPPLDMVPAAKSGPIAAAVSRALAASWRTITLPWHLTLAWLSWCSAVLIQLLTFVGAPPQGYVAQSKVRELNSIIDHMHTREDLYRKTIRELQEELEAKDNDKRRALKRLKSTKAESELMQQQLVELQEEYRRTVGSATAAAAHSLGLGGGGGVEGEALHRTALHLTMAALLVLVWWFYQQECHAIQRKLVFAVLFPVVWSYAQLVLSRRPVAHPVLLYSAAWALIGFVGAYKFAQLT